MIVADGHPVLRELPDDILDPELRDLLDTVEILDEGAEARESLRQATHQLDGPHSRPHIPGKLRQHVQNRSWRRRLKRLEPQVVRVDRSPTVRKQDDRSDVIQDAKDDLVHRQQFVSAVFEVGAGCQVGNILAPGDVFALDDQFAEHGQRNPVVAIPQKGLGIGGCDETVGATKQGGVVDGCLGGILFLEVGEKDVRQETGYPRLRSFHEAALLLCEEGLRAAR